MHEITLVSPNLAQRNRVVVQRAGVSAHNVATHALTAEPILFTIALKVLNGQTRWKKSETAR
jgi:hypothetical protein